MADGGVAGVTDGEAVGEMVEFWLIEDFEDEAHVGDGLEDIVVDSDNFDAFLAAMMERIEDKVVEARGLRVIIYAHHGALLAWLLIVQRTFFGVWQGGTDNVRNWVFGENEKRVFSGSTRGSGCSRKKVGLERKRRGFGDG